MKKLNRKQIGTAGEITAVNFLQSNGYKILTQNFRTKFGEIDIIGQDVQEVVFVEVKTRSSLAYGTPAEAVTTVKQKKLRMVASYYLEISGNISSPCRFDIIEVLLQNGIISCNHIKNAF